MVRIPYVKVGLSGKIQTGPNSKNIYWFRDCSNFEISKLDTIRILLFSRIGLDSGESNVGSLL